MILHQRVPRVVLVACLALVPASAMAAEARSPEWYEVATGVIAIPAALIGLAYSYLLIKKTRLEARKTELEIVEKERQLAQIASHAPSDLVAVVAPSRESRIILLLLLRFVVLYLILGAWGLFEDAFSLLFTGVVVGLKQLLSLSLSGWSVIPMVVVQKLPKVAYWLVFFSLAWPLFKDANAALGIDIRKFLKVSSLRELREAVEPKDG